MYYNILNFSPSLPENTYNLKNITNYIKPDILAVNEISNDTSAKHILEYVLNASSGITYKKAVFTEGTDTDNMLFYNSGKLSLYKQDTILTPTRIINEYMLYYNDSTYISLHDTVFIDLYSAHLKASPGYEQQRLNEVLKLKNYLYQNSSGKNIFFGGDMNFYNNYEPAFIELLYPGPYKLNDPLNAIGYWHDNSYYSEIHTQSTRVRGFGGGADGGMDDRFDFIFVSNDVIYGNNQIRYIPNSYIAFGNDGSHFNDSLTAAPLNPDIPDSIIHSLYNQSDHLPVIMKVYLNYDASVTSYADENDIIKIYPNPSYGDIKCIINSNISKANLEIFSSTGKQLNYYSLNNNNYSVSIKNLKCGIYTIKVIIDKNVFCKKLIVIR